MPANGPLEATPRSRSGLVVCQAPMYIGVRRDRLTPRLAPSGGPPTRWTALGDPYSEGFVYVSSHLQLGVPKREAFAFGVPYPSLALGASSI